MRVYIEPSAQKNIMKFVCDEVITPGSHEFNSGNEAALSPLAQHLFNFPFVEKVFITANFVAVQKSDSVEWEDVAQSVKEIVNDYLGNEQILLVEKRKEPYTLYAEMTPNPKVMKFVSNQMLVNQMAEIKSREEAEKVPLASAIFDAFDFVDEVFLSENYISVTKNEETDWQEQVLLLRQFILDYLQSGNEIIQDDYKPKSFAEHELLQTERPFTSTEQQIEKILKEYIQPAVANDGGNIALIEFDEGSKTAKMLLQGACSGCPSSTMTLKNGIESILKEMMPNIVENVEAING